MFEKCLDCVFERGENELFTGATVAAVLHVEVDVVTVAIVVAAAVGTVVRTGCTLTREVFSKSGWELAENLHKCSFNMPEFPKKFSASFF